VSESPNPNVIDTDTITGEMHPIRRAVISIGSNLGERRNNLQGAADSLNDTPEVWVTAVSPVYETEPVDAPAGSKDFLNAIVLLDTTLSARTLLDVFNTSSGRNTASADKFPKQVLPRTFATGFRLELMHKDVELCLAEARRQGVPMALGGAVGELWARAAASAAAGADCTEIVRMLEDDAGVVVGGE